MIKILALIVVVPCFLGIVLLAILTFADILDMRQDCNHSLLKRNVLRKNKKRMPI